MFYSTTIRIGETALTMSLNIRFHRRLPILWIITILITSCGRNSGSTEEEPPSGPLMEPPTVRLARALVKGNKATVTTIATHAGGAAQILNVQVIVGEVLDGEKGCFVEYDSSTKTFRIRSSGKWVESSVAPATHCKIDTSGFTSTVEGNSLQLKIPLELAPTLAAGKNHVWLIASTAKVHSGWKLGGELTQSGE